MWNEWAAKTTARQYPRGSQRLDKLIYLFKTQKRARRAPIPTLLFEIETNQTADIRQLHLSKLQNSLDDHVQFILTIMFMPRQCI